jgi:hypothetical protein
MQPKTECLATARKLVRTFASAPDPRRQARLIHAALLQGEPWEPAVQERVVGFGRWLESSPPVSELRGRCTALIARIPEPSQHVGALSKARRKA